MKTEEKILIESLFSRLLEVEKKSSKRDQSAEELIDSLIEKQKNAPYYLIQTVLVQETVLKKLNVEINELKKEITNFKEKVVEKDKKTSFLSGFFKNNKNKNSNFNSLKKSNTIPKEYVNNNIPSNDSVGSTATSGFSSSNNNTFLGNALQTAVGVAGGMVVGNMLTNMFQNNKNPVEEEIFTSVNNDNTYISNVDNDDENLSSHEDNDQNSHFFNDEDHSINEENESYDTSFFDDDSSSELEINDDVSYDDDDIV
ncbi:Putative uncharacterized protein Yba2 [Buchnera aphidicola (Tetraneura ulmi)]|uniref:DUF2076 family protein n=1 Tax=Buchnera aphidicola TaxID=9 RepID=UPI0034643B2D